MVDWNDEKECMDAVKKNNGKIQEPEIKFVIQKDTYVNFKNDPLPKIIPMQTEDACMASIRRPFALELVKNKTPDICLEAIKQNKDAIRFVPKEFVEIHKLWRLMYE